MKPPLPWIGIEALRSAACDYLYLLERSYSTSSALKLVGDRYRLGATERSMLCRGVAPRRDAARRKETRANSPRGANLLVDGHNVLFTVVNYLGGRQLFVGNDGFLRDSGELHGSLGASGDLARAARIVLDLLAAEAPESVLFALDGPVSRSGELAAELREGILTRGIPGGAEPVRSPDFALKEREEGMIATSDSGIIDRARVPVLDLARAALDRAFSPDFPDLALVV